jgi:hypothetical protein
MFPTKHNISELMVELSDRRNPFYSFEKRGIKINARRQILQLLLETIKPFHS